MKAYLEVDEVRRLEKATTNLRDRLLIKLLSHLGCRVSEALALEVKDIDFDSGTVTIQHLKARTKLSCPECGARLGQSHSYCPKFGAKVKQVITKEQEHHRIRTLPLDSETLELLRNYIKRGGPVNQKGKLLIFGINRHRAWQIIRNCAQKAKLPKLVNPETGRVHNVSPSPLKRRFCRPCG